MYDKIEWLEISLYNKINRSELGEKNDISNNYSQFSF